ncbi:MAG TPA: 16S rRNA (cytosine(1402)-N(4))-methyltransferase RsmH [Actinomycetota bacterium]|nr:16S rRNA (cytosine(1402)-N(4))-methyltransferase RsmH [Actinomycetota bacterium]
MDHEPVLADRVVELFLPALEHGGVVVDATLGRGGHALRILEAAPDASLIGIDRDPVALEASRANLEAFADRVRLVGDNFAELASVLERLGVASVRGVLLDLGVSSPQLDEPERGFSFRVAGPLDMRMDPLRDLSADTVVNSYDEPELARVIHLYGEERFARRIAKAIVRRRPIEDTETLAEVIKDAIPAATRRTGPHPARRTFQAIRIEVNDELRSLEAVLPAAVDALEPGGRVVVLSYHSLEDRIVKRFFLDQASGCVCPPTFPVCTCGAEARVRILTRRPVTAAPDEVERNQRASAAKLRAAQRIEAAGRAPHEVKRSA